MTRDNGVPEHHNKIRDTTANAIFQAHDIHGDVTIVVGPDAVPAANRWFDDEFEVEPVPLLGEAECVKFVRNHLGDAGGVVTYIDVDGLLGINHVYGRQAGDLVLETCGRLVRQIDGAGAVCRLRGDQYVVAQAGEVPNLFWWARQAVGAIRAHDWSTIAPDLHVSVTAAPARWDVHHEDVPTLILRAIMGVRMAKQRSKNCVGIAPLFLQELRGTQVERWRARVSEMSRYLSD